MYVALSHRVCSSLLHQGTRTGALDGIFREKWERGRNGEIRRSLVWGWGELGGFLIRGLSWQHLTECGSVFPSTSSLPGSHTQGPGGNATDARTPAPPRVGNLLRETELAVWLLRRGGSPGQAPVPRERRSHSRPHLAPGQGRLKG